LLAVQHFASAGQEVVEHTKIFESFAEPLQPDNDNDNVDKAQIRDDGSDVDKYLLIGFERLYIDTVPISTACRSACALAHVLSPDSVDALTPKK
jgi:hypothetical protein